jgi:hypothetical protein
LVVVVLRRRLRSCRPFSAKAEKTDSSLVLLFVKGGRCFGCSPALAADV